MGDWIGSGVIVAVIVAVAIALTFLKRPQTRTSDEFERKAAEGGTMMGAAANALQEAIDPAAARAKEVIVQMTDGNYQKKKREGKANSPEITTDAD
jgi:mannitol-specific phosphotransferase system IIBC component